MQNKSESRIAIVGAGASGIVCARELAKKGWKNVTVFEASDQPGGKTRSLTLKHPESHKPEVLELGTATILVGPVLDEILEETGLNKDLRNLPKVRVKNPPESNEYHPIFSPSSPPLSFPKKALEMLKFMGDIDGAKFLDQPGLKGLSGKGVSLPIEEWFKQNNLSFAKNIALPVISSGLCGMDFDRVPAVYMLKIYRLMLRVPLWRNALTLLRTIKSGNNEIWRRAAIDLDIHYNQSIQNLQLSNGQIKIATKHQEHQTFDRVIWTGGLPRLGKMLEGQSSSNGGESLSRAHYSLVQYLRRAVFTYRFEGLPRNKSWIHTENILKKIMGSPFACANVKGTDWYYFYPWLAPHQTVDDVDRIIREFAHQLGGRVTAMAADPVVWNYNPFFESEMLEQGVYDKIENEQGKNGIYVCGETLSGITLPAVTEYAKDLVQRHF